MDNQVIYAQWDYPIHLIIWPLLVSDPSADALSPPLFNWQYMLTILHSSISFFSLIALSHCLSLHNDLSHLIQCDEEHCWSVSDMHWNTQTCHCLKDKEYLKDIQITREEMSSELYSDSDRIMFHCSVSLFSYWELYADLNNLISDFLCLIELWQQSYYNSK